MTLDIILFCLVSISTIVSYQGLPRLTEAHSSTYSNHAEMMPQWQCSTQEPEPRRGAADARACSTRGNGRFRQDAADICDSSGYTFLLELAAATYICYAVRRENHASVSQVNSVFCRQRTQEES